MSRRWRLIPAVVTWLVVAVIAVGQPPQLSMVDHLEDEGSAVDLARRDAHLLVNLQDSNVERSLPLLKKDATGAWAEQLDGGRKELIASLRRADITARGRVDRVAVAEQSSDSETVLVAASSQLTGVTGSRTTTRTYYFVMRLERQDGRWQVASVEAAS